MNLANVKKLKCCWRRMSICLMTALSMVLLPSFVKTTLATENENVQYYKMLSAVEYTGNGQFKNHIETLFTVRKLSLEDDKVRYTISTRDFDLVEDNLNPARETGSKELSFIVDGKTGYLSGAGRELAILEKVNNECVKSLKKVTKGNIGKTWQETFNLSFLSNLLPDDINFNMKAIQVETKSLGEMTAVRAISEPFAIKTINEKGNTASIQARIGAAYLFDAEIEDIYLSISVFDATTKKNGGPKEKLHHEIATFRTNAAAEPVDLSGLGKKFEKLVRKLGLRKKGIKVVKEITLPHWARFEGLSAAQVTNICAATACEGALNPVATICIPAARTVALQSAGRLASIGTIGTVSGALGASIPAVGAMKIAVAPAFMGVGLGTAGIVAGGTVGTIAIAGGSSSSSRSP